MPRWLVMQVIQIDAKPRRNRGLPRMPAYSACGNASESPSIAESYPSTIHEPICIAAFSCFWYQDI